jgi:hypothetical protein
MSDQNLTDELTHAAKLDRKHRGELAELAFMRKAANLGFAVAKPWGDSDRYDVVVRFEKTFWRVQIKSVLALKPSRPHFVVEIKNSSGKTYTKDDIDFLVAYIFARDLWYVFPAHVFEHKKSLCVKPGSKKSRLEEYRENWDLMRSSGVPSAPTPTVPTTLPSHGDAAVSPPPAPGT